MGGAGGVGGAGAWDTHGLAAEDRSGMRDALTSRNTPPRGGHTRAHSLSRGGAGGSSTGNFLVGAAAAAAGSPARRAAASQAASARVPGSSVQGHWDVSVDNPAESATTGDWGGAAATLGRRQLLLELPPQPSAPLEEERWQSAQREQVLAKQQHQLQIDAIRLNNALIEENAESIQHVVKEVHAAGELFKDVATLVAAQTAPIESIAGNLELVSARVREGTREIEKKAAKEAGCNIC